MAIDPTLGPPAHAILARGLDALDALIDAPLRVLGHAAGENFEVFDLEEEFELGPSGRRFIMSVRLDGRGLLVLPLGAGVR